MGGLLCHPGLRALLECLVYGGRIDVFEESPGGGAAHPGVGGGDAGIADVAVGVETCVVVASVGALYEEIAVGSEDAVVTFVTFEADGELGAVGLAHDDVALARTYGVGAERHCQHRAENRGSGQFDDGGVDHEANYLFL